MPYYCTTLKPTSGKVCQGSSAMSTWWALALQWPAVQSRSQSSWLETPSNRSRAHTREHVDSGGILRARDFWLTNLLCNPLQVLSI